MEFSDADPIPGMGVAPLRRTYHSSHDTVTSLFGRGWVTFLDARATALRGPNQRSTVVLRLDDERRVVFEDQNGAYVQTYPAGDAFAGRLQYDAGIFRYRPAASRRIREFRESDGHLVAIGDAGGDRVTVSYDTAGRPASIADSQGRWSWALTYDSASRIATVSPTNHPELTWTYAYVNNNLTTVTAPGNAIWRTYTYGTGGLETIFDGDGRRIESHQYIPGTNSVTNSLEPNEQITSINTNLLGRVPEERETHVTTADGLSTTYYRRYIAGDARTVEIRGSCSCGMDDVVLGYNSAGQIVREQDGRGYITLRTFLDGRMTSLGRYYRPADCDPETDQDSCRFTPDALLTADIVPTALTTTTTLSYDDPNWPDLVTTRMAESLQLGQTRYEYLAYDTATGRPTSYSEVGHEPMILEGVRRRVTSQWGPLDPGITRTTTTTLYAVAEAARFNPCAAGSCDFESSWLTLLQPVGMPAIVDGPRDDVNDSTQYVYYPIDASVPADARGRLAAIQDGLGHITRFENYDVFGGARRLIDANGVITERTFDNIGRLLSSTLKGVAGCDTNADALCGTDLVSRRMYYSGTGQVAIDIGPRGEATMYEYDDWGRTTATTRGAIAGTIPGTATAAIAAATWSERQEYEYSTTTGRKTTERILARQGSTWIPTRATSFAYDTTGHVNTVTNADGSSIGYVYEHGQLATVKDENHTTPNTFYEYDAAGRLKEVRQNLAAASGGSITTSYTYDLHGNLQSVTDPNGNVTTYTYDDFGQMRNQLSAVTGIASYNYDLAGNLTFSTDGNLATTTRTYDDLNRPLTSVAVRDPDIASVTWTYDGSTADTFGIGCLASMADDDTSETYAYDRRGLLRQEDLSIWGDAFVQSYAYDESGNRVKIAYPSGRSVSYTYDYAGRPTTAAGTFDGTTTTYVSGATYLPFGPLTALSYGNSATESRTYDQRYRLGTLQLSHGGTTLASYAYSYDLGANILQITDATDAAFTRTFAYDELGRLVTSNTGTGLWGTGSYTYDSMGSMLTATLGSRARSFQYNGAGPRIETATDKGTVTQVAYDGAGNELNGPLAGPDAISDTRTYSPRNLLQEISRTSRYCLGPQQGEVCTFWAQRNSTIWNAYDGRGVRVASSETISLPPGPAEINYFFYTPELAQLSTSFPNEGTETDAIWFGGRPVASEQTGNPATRFTFTDHLGSPILQTDAAANVTWQAEYEPFGNVAAIRVGTPNDQRLRFSGQQVAFTNLAGDEESYNIFRWYRSGWGRYTQADPIIAPGVEYAYAIANPIGNTDRLGLFDTGSLAKEITRQLIKGCEETAPTVSRKLPIIGIIISLAFADKLNEHDAPPRDCDKCKKGKCRPCDPPVGTISYQIHTGHDHYPYGDPHLKLWQVNQGSDCTCYWNSYGYSDPPPPPGSVPYPGTSFAGGGGPW